MVIIKSSLKTSTNANGGVNNQQTPNTVNKDGSKGQTLVSTGDRTPLCYKCGDMVIMWLCAQVKVYTFVLKNQNPSGMVTQRKKKPIMNVSLVKNVTIMMV